MGLLRLDRIMGPEYEVFMVSVFLSLFEFITEQTCGWASRHTSGRHPRSRRADTFLLSSPAIVSRRQCACATSSES